MKIENKIVLGIFIFGLLFISFQFSTMDKLKPQYQGPVYPAGGVNEKVFRETGISSISNLAIKHFEEDNNLKLKIPPGR